jgi:nucleotide-binding universal stress UspA family protein
MNAAILVMTPGTISASVALEEKPVHRSAVALQEIVVPTDFTYPSGNALAFALRLSSTYGSRVTVLNAVDPFEYGFGSKELRELKRAQVWAAARESMAAWVKAAVKCTETALVEGDPAAALAKFVASRRVDLVVLGTAARKHAARALFGSMAEEIFRATPRPVLVIGPRANVDDRIAIRKLLFATNLEPHSLATLRALAILAADLDAQVSVIRVVHPDILSIAERCRISKETEEKVKAAGGAELWEHVDEVRLVSDNVVQGICETAVLTKADVIVMGVRGNVRWDRAATHLPWALAHRVIANATCPVLTLRG